MGHVTVVATATRLSGTVEVVVAVAAAVVLLAIVLGVRAARRRGSFDRELDARRLVVPDTPSLHSTVRVIEGPGGPASRPAPARPRLPADLPLVFGETPAHEAVSTSPRDRHDDEWALRHSIKRGRLAPGSAGVIAAVVAALVALLIAGAVIESHASSTTTSVTSTTTR